MTFSMQTVFVAAFMTFSSLAFAQTHCAPVPQASNVVLRDSAAILAKWHFPAARAGTTYCTSGILLAKVADNMTLFLMHVETRENPRDRLSSFWLVHQGKSLGDSSAQMVSPGEFQQHFNRLLGKVKFKSAGAFGSEDAIAIVRSTRFFEDSFPSMERISSLVYSVDQNAAEYYKLVSWEVSVRAKVNQPLLVGMLLRINRLTGDVALAEISDFDKMPFLDLSKPSLR